MTPILVATLTADTAIATTATTPVMVVAIIMDKARVGDQEVTLRVIPDTDVAIDIVTTGIDQGAIRDMDVEAMGAEIETVIKAINLAGIKAGLEPVTTEIALLVLIITLAVQILANLPVI